MADEATTWQTEPPSHTMSRGPAGSTAGGDSPATRNAPGGPTPVFAPNEASPERPAWLERFLRTRTVPPSEAAPGPSGREGHAPRIPHNAPAPRASYAMRPAMGTLAADETAVITAAKPDLIQCPRCNAANAEVAERCADCGYPFALRCPRCRTVNAANARSCRECGLPLAIEAQDAQASWVRTPRPGGDTYRSSAPHAPSTRAADPSLASSAPRSPTHRPSGMPLSGSAPRLVPTATPPVRVHSAPPRRTPSPGSPAPVVAKARPGRALGAVALGLIVLLLIAIAIAAALLFTSVGDTLAHALAGMVPWLQTVFPH